VLATNVVMIVAGAAITLGLQRRMAHSPNPQQNKVNDPRWSRTDGPEFHRRNRDDFLSPAAAMRLRLEAQPCQVASTLAAAMFRGRDAVSDVLSLMRRRQPACVAVAPAP
jgi:hypothetical protein